MMEFQLSYLKSKKMMLWKCCTQYASKFGKFNSGHRTGKDQFPFKSQRMFKPLHNCTHLTHEQSNSQNSLSQASTVHEPGTSRCSSWIQKRQMNQRPNCRQLLNHQKSKRLPEKHLLLLYWLHQSLWLSRSQQTVKNSSRDGNTRPPDLPPKKSVCRSRSNS